jgi:hypothetical protein
MSEKIPPQYLVESPDNAIDIKLNQLVTDALSFMKRAWGLELNNFELMKLFHIARRIMEEKESVFGEAEALTREEKFSGENWNDLSSYSFGPMEIVNRFVLSEYGVHPQEFPKEKFGGITEDFKKYLKILQKRHRDGDDEQSQLTHE